MLCHAGIISASVKQIAASEAIIFSSVDISLKTTYRRFQVCKYKICLPHPTLWSVRSHSPNIEAPAIALLPSPSLIRDKPRSSKTGSISMAFFAEEGVKPCFFLSWHETCFNNLYLAIPAAFVGPRGPSKSIYLVSTRAMYITSFCHSLSERRLRSLISGLNLLFLRSETPVRSCLMGCVVAIRCAGPNPPATIGLPTSTFHLLILAFRVFRGTYYVMAVS